MDSRWIEAQRREMEKLISPELIKSRDLARQSYFDQMEKEMADHVSRSIEPLSGKKQSTLVELRSQLKNWLKSINKMLIHPAFLVIRIKREFITALLINWTIC